MPMSHVKFEQEAEEESELSTELNDDDMDVTITSKLVECPICFQPLQLPVFQCKNGHVTCSQCSSIQCRTCSASDTTRCFLLESIIESYRVRCPYAKIGCTKASLQHSQISAHKSTCSYAPCYCPVPECNFRSHGLKLSTHVDTKHHRKFFVLGRYFTISIQKEQPFYILRGRNDVYVLLNRRLELGHALWIVQVSPGSDKGLSYELEVGNNNTVLEKSLKLKGFVEKVRNLDMGSSPEFYLDVPQKLFDLTLDVDVRIKIGTRKKLGGMC